jgi:hypothetical protein
MSKIAALLVLTGCLESRGEYPVVVGAEVAEGYLEEMDVRMKLWRADWGLQPFTLPGHSAIRTEAHWYEFRPLPGTTCYFHKPNRIAIGSDKWESGCVPHELGHLALFMSGHPCWGEYEHPKEKAKCLGRLR